MCAPTKLFSQEFFCLVRFLRQVLIPTDPVIKKSNSDPPKFMEFFQKTNPVQSEGNNSILHI